MREIKFRAWIHEQGRMVNVIGFDFGGNNSTVQWYDSTHDALSGRISDAFMNRTEVMQYTGLKDKNGKEIYEGDVLRIRRPGRDTQTHYGDNIPLGSYTEPMEPVVTEEIVSVMFADGGFGYIQTADKPHYTVDDDLNVIPLSWVFHEISATNEDELKELFSGNWGHRILEGWEDDKQYLFETYKVSSVEELMNYIGVEVIGNIYEHPHLLEPKDIESTESAQAE